MIAALKQRARLAKQAWRRSFSARALRAKGIQVGPDFSLDGPSRVEAWDGGRLTLGARVVIGPGVRIQVFGGGELTVGDGVMIRDHCCLEVRGRMTIGDGAYLNNGVVAYCNGEITVGAGALLAPYVFLSDHEHCIDRLDVPIRLQGFTPPRAVRIGADAWLGTKVSVTKGVTVGEGAVIGANAVVTKDVPSLAIAVGIPARVVRFREGAALPVGVVGGRP